MSTYRTRDGEVIDEICKAHYGTEGRAEDVYAANPGLAAQGPVLQAGTLITLPEVSDNTVRQPIRLWGSGDAN
jgi:phage tail protein X